MTVNQTGLAAGFYYGLVRVDSPSAANTPQIVVVVLRVLAEGEDPGPAVRPTEMIFTAVEGRSTAGIPESFRIQRFRHATNVHFELHGIQRGRCG